MWSCTGALIGLVQVGDEGRYEFRNVPLVLGSNAFRLVFYGPQGEVRESRSTRTVTTVGEDTDRSIFKVALSQPGRSLYSATEPAQDQSDAIRFAGSLSDGLGRGVSVSASAVVGDIEAGTGRSVSAALALPALGGRTTVNSAYSIDSEQFSLGWNLSRRLAGQQFSIGQSFPEGVGSGVPFSTDASLSGALGDESREYPYRVSGAFTRSADSKVDVRVNSSIGTGLGRLRLTAANAWRRSIPVEGKIVSTLTGTLGASWFFQPVSLRGILGFTVLPDFGFTTGTAQFGWRLLRNPNTSIQITEQLASGQTRVRGSLSYSHDRFTISPSFSWVDNGQLLAFLSLRFGAGVDPYSGETLVQGRQFTGGGAISAHVFLDENGNGRYDDGEPGNPDARVRALQVNRGGNTNEEGVAFIVGLPAYVPTDVTVDAGSFENPFWALTDPGRSIVPRPGSIHRIEFPVTVTSEIEGTVVGRRPEIETDQLLSGVEIRLFDVGGQVVASEVSVFDGFYLFTNVRPGTYRLEVSEIDAAAYRLTAPPPAVRDILPAEAGVVVVDFVLTPTGQPGTTTDTAREPVLLNLGTFESVTGAGVGWVILQRRFESELSGLARIAPAQADPAGVPDEFKLLAGPLSVERAAIVCAALSAHGQFCAVSGPAQQPAAN